VIQEDKSVSRTDKSVQNRTASRIVDVLLVAGLVLLLVGLPFHLVIKRLIPGPVGTYWKESLLGLLVLLWAIRCIVKHRVLLTGTPLDAAVLVYLGLLVLRLILDRPNQVSLWGFYVSVLYMPLYWLVPWALRSNARRFEPHSKALWLAALLVGIGTLLALGGLAEFLLDRTLWPSGEITQRLGHPDFYIYGTQIRRVYFTLDSPTTLANTLATLLPLALSLALIPAPWMPGSKVHGGLGARLAAAMAALLMMACIVVTFSRGIWVATVLAFPVLFVGALTQAPQGARWMRTNGKLLLSAVAVLAIAGVVWGIAAIVRSPSRAPSPWETGVVEFSPAAYAAAPVHAIHQELLQDDPTSGQSIPQTWTLLDPISGEQDTRTVLYEHPPQEGRAELTYRVRVPQTNPQKPALRFAIAISPEVWSPDKGDGTDFQVSVVDLELADAGDPVFVRYINPKHNPSDRRWRNFIVDLSRWEGRTIDLALITLAGPSGDWAFDWGGWADPQIVTVDPDVFAEQARDENPILRHARSIVDWARDETNRDRLAAWNLSWTAWRAAPLWGRGLGSTGVAALRTNPGQAFVTESQVLKALVELGLPGLLALAFLWFQIAYTGYRAYRSAAGSTAGTRHASLLLLAILTSLAIVFLEGWVYQNLEVKQVNAYFWTLVGLLGFLAQRPESRVQE